MAEILYGGKTWLQILAETNQSIADLNITKGAEYAASDTDQLANFRRYVAPFGLPMEVAWAMLANKHWDALETYIRDLIEKKEKIRSEPLEGRVDDLIVYLILFKAMLAERATKSVYCVACGAATEEAINGCKTPSLPGYQQIPF